MEKFRLKENLFSEELRQELPVNLFLLRNIENEKVSLKKIRKPEKTPNLFYNTKNMKVGYYYKSISNIL